MADHNFATTRALLDEWTVRQLLPGVAVLAQHAGQRLFSYASGLASLEPPVPADTDHVWQVASISKPVATMALMQMVDQGLVGLDQPVVELLPAFAPDKDGVLVRHLVTHTSGLDDVFPDIEQVRQIGPVAAIGAKPLLFEPGTATHYSTPPFELAKAIVCSLSGLDWVQYTGEKLFAPLGMGDSSYQPPDALNSRIPLVYDAENSIQNWANDPVTRSFAIAGGGLYSTLADLAAFGQAWLDGGRGVISTQSYQAMTSLQTGGLHDVVSGRVDTWGLGWRLNIDGRGRLSNVLSSRAYIHGGATGTWLAIDPERELVLVMLANRLGIPHTLATELREALASAALRDMVQLTDGEINQEH